MSMLLLGVAVLGLSLGYGGGPVQVWEYTAESNLYAAPVVADVHATAGLESIICDSAARKLLCVSAEGKLLWSYSGAWKKRLVSGPAVGYGARVAVANDDGSLHCVDGATGTVLWRREVGGVEWGGVLWTQLDDTPALELVVGTESGGVIALDETGNELWRCTGGEGLPTLDIRLPLAAADVTGDGKAEIFGVDQRGPFSVGSAGDLRWRHSGIDDFISAATVVDLEHDGHAEFFCLSREEDFLWRFSASTGDVEWRTALLGGPDVYAGSSIAAGDLNADGTREMVVGDSRGRTYAVGADGALWWTHQTQGEVHAVPVVENVNDDDFLEVLVSSGDHGLYLLGHDGVLQWRGETGLRLTSPPSLADIDGDGLVEMLLCGNDRRLRCYRTGARAAAAGDSWPARGRDAAQSSSDTAGRTSEHFAQETELVSNGGFDELKVTENPQGFPKTEAMEAARRTRPRGWRALEEDADWSVQAAANPPGGHALRATGDATISSDPAPVPAGLHSVRLQARQSGTGTLAVQWGGADGLLSEQTLEAASAEWSAQEINFAPVPPRARWVQVMLKRSGEGETQWDDVRLVGKVRQRMRGDVLVNQAGYELDAPKHFVVQANFKAAQATFEVVSAGTGEVCLRGAPEYTGRIVGRFGSDWGHEYWRGDFSALRTPGEYRVNVMLDNVPLMSYSFRVEADLLWNRTAGPAYRFFYYQRCGMAIPGFHGACHLDDARDPGTGQQYELSGGWHDAGDYNKYHNAPYLLGLARAYGMARDAFRSQDEDGDGRDEFLEELLWGAEHVRRMTAPDGSAYGEITSGYGFWGAPELETDNAVATGDERPLRGAVTGNDPSIHHAALARVAVLAPEPAPWVETAQRGLQWALDHGQRGLAQCSTALDLFATTGEEQYAALARELVPAPAASVEVVDVLERFDAAFGGDHRAGLREALVKQAESMLPLAANVFGVYTFGAANDPNFFNTPEDKGGWHVGTSSRLLEAAALMALAYRYEPDPRYLAFVVDQFNWILGMNPFNISLMEGVGSAFPPSYHHRYTGGGVARGAVPGSVVNGVTWKAIGEDRPFMDMSGADIPAYESNEVWLPHNTNYLNALVCLRRGLGAAR